MHLRPLILVPGNAEPLAVGIVTCHQHIWPPTSVTNTEVAV